MNLSNHLGPKKQKESTQDLWDNPTSSAIGSFQADGVFGTGPPAKENKIVLAVN